MSLHLQDTLKSADDHAHQVEAMQALVSGLTSEGMTDVHYSSFATEDATRFIGLLEFPDDAGKQAFLDSAAFAAYREVVGPTFANPPETTEIAGLASTRGRGA